MSLQVVSDTNISKNQQEWINKIRNIFDEAAKMGIKRIYVPFTAPDWHSQNALDVGPETDVGVVPDEVEEKEEFKDFLVQSEILKVAHRFAERALDDVDVGNDDEEGGGLVGTDDAGGYIVFDIKA